jgi:hypothetical protein
MMFPKFFYQKDIQILFRPFLILIAFFFLLPSKTWRNNFFYFFILIPGICVAWRDDLSVLLKSRIYGLSIILCIYMFLSCLWSTGVDAGELLANLKYLLSQIMFITLMVLLFVKQNNNMKTLLYILFGAAVTGACLSIANALWNHLIPNGRLFFWGSMPHPISGASMYCIGICAGLFCIDKDIKDTTYLKYVEIAGLIIACISVLLSKSRAPIISLFFMFMLYAGTKKSMKGVLLLLVLPITVYCIALWSGSDLINTVIERESYRFEIWSVELIRIKSHFLFGNGLLSDDNLIIHNGIEFIHPHSVYIATIFYGGIFACCLLLFVLFSSFHIAIRWFVQTKDALCICMILLATLLVATDGSKIVTKPNVIWLIFWLPICFCMIAELRLPGKAECNLLYQTRNKNSGKKADLMLR